jgi:hypothetical protein
LRAGLGGAVCATADVLYVLLRGPQVATLSRLILQPHKLQMRGPAARLRPDPHLRAVQEVQQERCWVLAVEVVLAGGRSEVRTAEGVVLALGAR